MANYSQCQFIGGWVNEQSLLNNFNVVPTDEEFFLINKNIDNFSGSSGVVIFKQYGYYAYVIRDINSNYDTKADWQPGYTTKSSLLYYLKSEFGGAPLISNLTEEEKERIFNTIENN